MTNVVFYTFPYSAISITIHDLLKAFYSKQLCKNQIFILEYNSVDLPSIWMAMNPFFETQSQTLFITFATQFAGAPKQRCPLTILVQYGKHAIFTTLQTTQRTRRNC